MDSKSSPFVLENGLDLKQIVSTGSVLYINEDYNEAEIIESERNNHNSVDFIGAPVKNFDELEKEMTTIDEIGFVKKKIIHDGGGLPLTEDLTVSIEFSGYWENEPNPFDTKSSQKPLTVNLQDNGLLPGLNIAIKSMLVGELSVFLLTHQVMYGEMGIPPRIKPKAKCIFYIKLLKSIITPKDGPIEFSEPNMFQRVFKEVKLLYSSGVSLHKTNNIASAINLFKRATIMLHKCRLADENEEAIQEKMLIKLYINLSICYNKTKQPLSACIACNELNRLNSLWNNGKVLFQNAKALRMIGQFDSAEKRLRRAIKLFPDDTNMQNEMALLVQSRDSCNQNKLVMNRMSSPNMQLISDSFKEEVNKLIKNFKENDNLNKLTIPEGLNKTEMSYIKEVCIRENLFFSKLKKVYSQSPEETSFALDKENEDEIYKFHI